MKVEIIGGGITEENFDRTKSPIRAAIQEAIKGIIPIIPEDKIQLTLISKTRIDPSATPSLFASPTVEESPTIEVKIEINSEEAYDMLVTSLSNISMLADTTPLELKQKYI